MPVRSGAARVGTTGGRGNVGAGSRSCFHSTTSGRGVQGRPVHRADGRVVGHVRDRTLWKVVRASRHQLRNPPAWAFDIESLVEAIGFGAELVAIHETETVRTYSASIDLLVDRGFLLDRGHGPQIGLALPHFRVRGEGHEPVEQLALPLSGGGR